MTPVTPKYQFVSTLKGLKQALAMCHGDTSLDFETTALRPSEGRVRLVSLHGEAVSALVDFDGIRGGFRRVAKLFDRPGVRWIVFNSVFEMSWFLDAGVQPAMMDVGLMRKAVLGGGNASRSITGGSGGGSGGGGSGGVGGSRGGGWLLLRLCLL